MKIPIKTFLVDFIEEDTSLLFCISAIGKIAFSELQIIGCNPCWSYINLALRRGAEIFR